MTRKQKYYESLNKVSESAWMKGVQYALSVAVNHYNVPESVREGIMQLIEIEKNEKRNKV